MTSGQKSFPVAPSQFRFTQHGQAGIWLSENLPHLAKVVDDVCVIKSMHTEAINHDPAATLFQTGSVIAGRPSMGAWVNYGLGTENENLPAFVAMTSNGSANAGQPLYDRLWGAGFLPGQYQGVKFRGQGDPILDLYNPDGVTQQQRRRMLDSSNSITVIGMLTIMHRNKFPTSAATRINQPQRFCGTSNSVACWRTRLSSGVANLGVRFTAKANSPTKSTVAIITRTVSLTGWPVEASAAE